MTSPYAPVFQQTAFLQSASNINNGPDDSGREIAFAGRSNAGKSSAINCITQQGKLARTSKTPGRTQLLNYFQVSEDETRLVDLPGYGFAKVAQNVRQAWERTIDQYLRERQSLCGLFLIMDVRHPLTPFDTMMLEWSTESELPVHILLTKADKLKYGAAKNTLMKVKTALKAYPLTSIQLFSATKRTGVDEAQLQLAAWLELPEPKQK